MNIVSFCIILTGVLLNAVAQLALKASVREMGAIGLNFSSSTTAFLRLACEPFLWAGLVCYGISVVVWILALSRVDVSIAYPMLSMGYVVNAFFAWQLFGESMNPARLIGMGIVLLGVYVLARS
ncbi:MULTISPECIES: SMR family transporter [Methylobacter]|uniref:Multidrug transporter EmrE-like cation transporter n=1 Tax=Methylobacter tundripaludum TaxID=173365 RepID=A0A2S6HJY7_9GAMM|nr:MULTISPECIES: SMR family transporter [Methylobacter]MDI1278327.1 SMR family transporter [Methylobacter sp.]MDI1359051.1 SMR family transporter [Methylobacter sp.]PPK77776.1 multidrug transporter EmrE-like cation transporter [Methylobacter tundripaludum]